jgi:hypothetical protein
MDERQESEGEGGRKEGRKQEHWTSLGRSPAQAIECQASKRIFELTNYVASWITSSPYILTTRVIYLSNQFTQPNLVRGGGLSLPINGIALILCTKKGTAMGQFRQWESVSI